MNRSSDRARVIKILAAAKLSHQGVTQVNIAKILGVSQPEVSRFLWDAERDRWLGTPVRAFTPTPDVEHLLPDVEATYFSSPRILDGLKKRYARGAAALRRITLVHADRGESSRSAARESPRSAAFHGAIADVFRDRLSTVDVVGVTWGNTIGDLLNALRQQITEPPRRHKPIQFVPLCGEPF